jgi:hypothetical protein
MLRPGLKRMRVVKRRTALGMELFESVPLGTVYIANTNDQKALPGCAGYAHCRKPEHLVPAIAVVREDLSDGGDWGYLPLELLEDVPEQVN